MTEVEICDWLYNHHKAGQKRYLSGERCPHAANTVAYLMDVLGWVSEDLRQSLMKADPIYGEGQRRYDATVAAIEEEEAREKRQADSQFGVGA